MTSTEREELLRRYIEQMTSELEEQNPPARDTFDPELRRELKLHREIDQAFEADRGIPTAEEYASLSAGVAAMLPTMRPLPADNPASFEEEKSPTSENRRENPLAPFVSGIAGVIGIAVLLFFVLLPDTMVEMPRQTKEAPPLPNGVAVRLEKNGTGGEGARNPAQRNSAPPGKTPREQENGTERTGSNSAQRQPAKGTTRTEGTGQSDTEEGRRLSVHGGSAPPSETPDTADRGKQEDAHQGVEMRIRWKKNRQRP